MTLYWAGRRVPLKNVKSHSRCTCVHNCHMLTVNLSDAGYSFMLKPPTFGQTHEASVNSQPKQFLVNLLYLHCCPIVLYSCLCLRISLCPSFCGWWGQRILFIHSFIGSSSKESVKKYELQLFSQAKGTGCFPLICCHGFIFYYSSLY